MRVLLVSGSLPPLPCGVGAYTLKLAQALAEDPDTHVAVLTGRHDGPVRAPAGVEIIPSMGQWRMSEMGRIMAAIRNFRPDIVHVQYPTQGYGHARLPSLVPLVARLFGRRAVSTWHEIYDIRGIFRFLAQSWPSSAAIVARPDFDAKLPALLRRLTTACPRTYLAQASSIPASTASPAALAKLRSGLLQGKKRLLVFFGFVHEQKGVEDLFDIADPATDHLVIAGPSDAAGAYHARLLELAARPSWQGRVTMTGVLTETQGADLLAAADAVVLPFRAGSGAWNSSVHAASLQGTPVITTSTTELGLDSDRLLHRSRPGDIAGMRAGLAALAGTRRRSPAASPQDEWARIARQHEAIYADILAGKRAIAA